MAKTHSFVPSHNERPPLHSNDIAARIRSARFDRYLSAAVIAASNMMEFGKVNAADLVNTAYGIADEMEKRAAERRKA